jgi:hypothetical protein
MEKELVQVLADLQKAQGLMLDRMERQDKETRTKTPASSGNAVELHGVGSLFGSHSIEREVITAHMRPFGLGARLPNLATVFAQPFYASITGFTADVGSEPETPCADAPRSYMKGCDLTAQFGRVQRDTGTIEINDVILKKNRGDFTDLLLYGNLLGDSGFTPGGLTDADVLNLVTKAEMITAAISLERKLSRHLWSGSIFANNGAYKEFPGLQYQIATGQMDAHTGTLCAALDSDVKNFGFQSVEARNSLRDIVDYLSALEYNSYYNADRMGLLPLTAVIAMRPELWFVLSAMWPCAYNTNSCGVAPEGNLTAGQPFIDAGAMRQLRDDMRQGMFIDINGRRYPVVTDDGIPELNNTTTAGIVAGCYASSIFFVPLTAAGLQVTYMEHVDYRAAAPEIALLRGTEQFWTDDGRYFWAIEHAKWCYKLSVKTEQRVILRTPQLAGRIDNVGYCPTQHLRSSDPSSPYFKDGGVSMRSDETTYHVW